MDPGESLFCGDEVTLHPSTIEQQKHEDEEEDLMDQHRRNAELGGMIAGAFDDLTDSEEDQDDDASYSSGQSFHEESPQKSPMGHLSYDETPSSSHHKKYLYQNGSSGSSKARHLIYQDEDALKTNERLPSHQSIPNGYPQTEDSKHNGLYHHPAYHGVTGHMDGDSYSPTFDDYYRSADLGSLEEVKVLYTARAREVISLSDNLQCLRQEKDSEIELLKRELSRMKEEKQAALESQKEMHNLLAASKTQVNSLQQERDQLHASNVNLKEDKAELLKEVNLFKISAADLQQQVTLLQRNGNTTRPSEKQMESFYKDMQERHQIQLKDMESQLANAKEKLEIKEGECVALEEKLRHAIREYDALQVAKAETVNKLAAQLEQTQQKMQRLASNSSVHEMTKLQIMLEQTQNDKKALEKKLASTSKKLEAVENDLLQYESASRLGLFNNDDSSFETDSITHMGISQRRSSGGKSEKHAENSRDSCRSKRSSGDQEDLSSQLKTELHRALQGQRSKREEIRRLQEQLAAKEKKIKTMLEQEQVYVTESKKYEANLTGILGKLKRQQEDLKTANNNEAQLRVELEKNLADAKEMVERIQSLEKEKASLKEQVLAAQREETEIKFDMKNYDEALKRAKEEIPPSIEKELIDLKVRLEQSQKECAEIKKLYSQISAEKGELMTRLKEKDSRLANELQTLKTGRDELEARYRESLETIKNLKADQDKLQKSVNNAVECTPSERSLEFDKAKEESERKCMQLQKKIVDLEAERLQLREELVVAHNRHQKEFERTSKELICSRERVLQLERKLREDFQTQIDSMTSEISNLQKQIDQKNQLLEEYAQTLSRLKPATKDAAVETTDEGLREKMAALAVQLEKAEERHRNIVETLRQEFDRRIAAREKEIKTAHERQLELIAARYKTEVAAIEDQVKEEAAKYFAEEVTALREKHAQEQSAFVKRMKESEGVFADRMELLKKALQERMKEVEELKKKVENGNCDVKQLQQQIDLDRNKMTEMVNCWAAEMHDLKDKVTTQSEELGAVQAKYKEMKKLAKHYKKQVVQTRQDEKEDWQRREMGYREALCRVKEGFNEIVENHEKIRRHSVEKLYENQLLDMAAKMRNETKFNHVLS